jgi:hypothetical protein
MHSIIVIKSFLSSLLILLIMQSIPSSKTMLPYRLDYFNQLKSQHASPLHKLGNVIKSLDLKISNPSGRDISSSSDKKNALVLKLLGLMYFIGHILFVFAPYYTRVFMKYIPLFEDGLNSEEEEIQSMAIYFFCVSLTVCNGIPEAFVESIAPIDLFGTMNFSLVLSSVIFFLSFPFLYTSFGIRGVIIAKCFSLLLSALLNLRFISSYFSQHHSLPPLTISIYLKKIKIFPTEPMLIKMLGNSSAAYAGDGIIFDHIVIGGNKSYVCCGFVFVLLLEGYFCFVF